MSAIAPLLECKRTYVGHRQKLLSRPRKTLGFETPAERFNARVAAEPPKAEIRSLGQVGIRRGQDQAARSGLSVRVGAAEATK